MKKRSVILISIATDDLGRLIERYVLSDGERQRLVSGPNPELWCAGKLVTISINEWLKGHPDISLYDDSVKFTDFSAKK